MTNRTLRSPTGALFVALILGFLPIGGCTTTAASDSPTTAPAADAGPACPPADFSKAVPLSGNPDDATGDACVRTSFFDAVSDVRVVCSGEGSHGVAESTPAHLAVARELLIHRAYRTLALELDDASAALLSAFVNDDDETALANVRDGKYTLAATSGSDAFYRALRDLRRELPASERVELRGLDVAIVSAPTRDRLFAYLERVDAATASAYDRRVPRSVTAASADDAASATEELRGIVESKRGEYSAKDAAGYELAALDVRMLEDGYRFQKAYPTGDFVGGNATLRDPAMARNLLAFAEKGNVMVIAHEAHCAHDSPSQGTKRSAGTFSFGRTVTERLGSGYVVLGQVFSEGKELWPDGSTHAVVSLPNSVQKAIAGSTDLSSLLIRTSTYDAMDLKKDWPLDHFDEKTSPAKQLDALFWIRRVSATRFL